MSTQPRALTDEGRDMDTKEELERLQAVLQPSDFHRRHIGPRAEQVPQMLKVIGASSLEDLVSKTVPADIRLKRPLSLLPAETEAGVLAELKQMASKNKVFRSYIGCGFANTITPPVILRNILENPGWYTQYTPYQAEISQGRLEALLNFQTMISDLTALEISNASLLDEGSAAAEAMMLAARMRAGDSKNKLFVADDCHPHVIDVVQTRAKPLGIEVILGSASSFKLDESYFATIVSYPTTSGEVVDYGAFTKLAHDKQALVIACCDLLALTLLKPPGEWGADIAVGNSQRFGVPLGFGGPHAAFMATRDEFKRELPGRLVGVSKDARGKKAYRLSLQTREQHIRRDRATSNICTAQVLLAVMASMYAVYHGRDGLRAIATRVQRLASALTNACSKLGLKPVSKAYFDTVCFELKDSAEAHERALRAEINLRWFSETRVGVTIDETTTTDDVADLAYVLTGARGAGEAVTTALEDASKAGAPASLPAALIRTSGFLAHPVFQSYQSEHEMLRYITRLQSKDLSLTSSMIPLGSCTMKLNATAEMIPVSWPELASIHPFAPLDQSEGYRELISGLQAALSEITGLPGVSLQPNAGSQGEYAGLLVIRAYHENRGQTDRTVCLIPASAHGTNPATAAMAGMTVVGVACDSAGNVDVADLRAKATEHSSKLAALMVTYPSTHGVFEESIREICEIVHSNGGLVYMDGANMNAQVGLCRPGDFGVDVCHLNLHKTFCIPHGGGGPGVGPIAVSAKLSEFLPGHFHGAPGGSKAIGPVCSAPWGSAGILVIPYVYIRLMGASGLKLATEMAILNANYIAARLEPHFPVLYRGKNGFVAHECILDLRSFKRLVGIEVADVAKRLMDYGFHAPTVSFPVVETLMVEPTESESVEELDRFCDAMISIREEIREIETGAQDKSDNTLKNAPHTADMVAATEWTHGYSRERAAFPSNATREHKFWPAVARIDNAWGDRNLFCACPPVTES